ncbi:MAG: alginate export family protein [Candidatus Omnitrophica bacterium]|nr:alginate export family protein [Candidatus Omnitrophota bacterium]
MKKSPVFFFLIVALLLFTHLGFVAEANAFLNGAPALLSEMHPVKDVAVKIGGEARYRLELRNNFNFNDRTYEDDALNLFRLRFNLNIKAGPYAQFFVEGQTAQSSAQSSIDRSAAFVNELDLRQLYADFKSPVKAIPLQLKAGRQVLSYGNQRFVGGFEWSNVARVFDAVKVVYPLNEKFQTDVFIAHPVRTDKEKADPTVHHDHFYGIYSVLKPLKDHILDTFLFIRHDSDEGIRGERSGEFGPLKEYTAGNRFKGKIKNFDYETEYAFQFGSRAHDDIAAWAFHQQAGYVFAPIFWTPRVYAEYNHASGDKNPADGRYGNFDNLFPTNHDKYGFMDFLSLRNMNNIRLGMGVIPHPALSLSADFHWFFLDTNKSHWFNASQAVLRSTRANARKELGQELDFLLKWKINNFVDFLMGYSHFFPGAFAEDTGASNGADFFYVQPTIKF